MHSKLALKIVTALTGILLMTACAPDKPPKIAEDQRAALDKAKAVEATMNEQAIKQQQQIDQAGNP